MKLERARLKLRRVRTIAALGEYLASPHKDVREQAKEKLKEFQKILPTDELDFLTFAYAHQWNKAESDSLEFTDLPSYVKSLIKKGLIHMEEKGVRENIPGTVKTRPTKILLARPTTEALLRLKEYDPVEVVNSFIREGSKLITEEKQTNPCLGCAAHWIMFRMKVGHLPQFISHELPLIRTTAGRKLRKEKERLGVT